MAIIVTSAGSHSIRITNSSASPQSNVFCNMSTINVIGDVYQQAVNLQNSNGQVVQVIPLKQLTTVAASTPTTLQMAVDAIASLIIA